MAVVCPMSHGDETKPAPLAVRWKDALKEKTVQVLHPSRTEALLNVRTPGLAGVTVRYDNPNRAVDPRTWTVDSHVLQGGFRKHVNNAKLSFIRLSGNASPPYETFQLSFSKPATAVSFPVCGFDESGPRLTFSTPNAPSTTFSKQSGASSTGGTWLLEGGALRYRGKRFWAAAAADPRNIVMLTVANPNGFKMIQVQPNGPAGTGMGDLSIEFAEPPDPAAHKKAESEVAALIAQLGAEEFKDREAASKALRTLSLRHYGVLKRAYQTTRDPEVKSRLKDLLADGAAN